MSSISDLELLLVPVLKVAVAAGDAILEVYASDDIQTERKADNSPLTLADRRSHDVIDAGLRALTPDLPVLSEEGGSIPYSGRAQWSEYWLVDPLDGTREFIKRNGEFTVNVALIRGGEPVLGVVYAPVREVAWFGVAAPRRGRPAAGAAAGSRPAAGAPGRAWRLAVARAEQIGPDFDLADAEPIQVKRRSPDRLSVIASRSHAAPATDAYIAAASAGFGEVERVSGGSSIKLCLVAEGRVDLYPRQHPTSEWDTAAGHAVIRAAGGEVFRIDRESGETTEPLLYNKEDLLNPWFVARAW